MFLNNCGTMGKNCVGLSPSRHIPAKNCNAQDLKKKISDLERARRFLVSSMMAINGVFGEDPVDFHIQILTPVMGAMRV